MEAPNELLMQAIYKKDIRFISCYRSRGVNINKLCLNGMTLLGVAAQTGNLLILKALIEYHGSSSNLDFRNENYRKPQGLQLDLDAEAGQKRCKNIGYFVVRHDLEENEFGEGPTPEGMEALEWDMEITESSVSGDPSETDDHDLNMYKWYANILNRTSIMLESPERDVSRLDRHGKSVFHYAVNSRNVDMVEYLISAFGKELSVNQNDAARLSPLHMAATNGDHEMVRWLLGKKANVKILGVRHCETALYAAASRGDAEVMRSLIEAGAHINAEDIEGRSLLATILDVADDNCIRLLIESGASVNHEEPGGLSALYLAVSGRDATAVKILLKAGAKIVHSHYLLHMAVTNEDTDIVEILIKAGIELNIRDSKGYTPLMVACAKDNMNLASLLLENGANVNATSFIDGKNALHVCVQYLWDYKSIYFFINLLVSYGADLNAPSYEGNLLLYSIFLQNRNATMALIQHGVDVNLQENPTYVDNVSLARRHGDINSVIMMVYAGYKVGGLIVEPLSQPDEIYDFLLENKTNPLSLHDMCRIAIRKRLGNKKLIAKLMKLPLPISLIRFLKFDIV